MKSKIISITTLIIIYSTLLVGAFAVLPLSPRVANPWEFVSVIVILLWSLFGLGIAIYYTIKWLWDEK